jgi:hypothetical protein
LALSQAYSGPTAVLFNELDTRGQKRLLNHDKRCLTRLYFVSLKEANRRNPNARSIRELLLTPIKKPSRRSALGGCEHGEAMEQ